MNWKECEAEKLIKLDSRARDRIPVSLSTAERFSGIPEVIWKSTNMREWNWLHITVHFAVQGLYSFQKVTSKGAVPV